MIICGACSSDEEAIGRDAGVSVDMGGRDAAGDDAGPAREDMATADMAAADLGEGSQDAGPTPGRYDGRLAELGQPGGTCGLGIAPLPVEGQGGAEARVFAPSWRLELGRGLESIEVYREGVHRFVFDEILPCLAEERPNLVVFPEAMSLPMMLLGSHAQTARQRPDSATALAEMAGVLAEAREYYLQRFPEITLPNSLLLAQTDTLLRATLDTYAQLADRYDLHISVTVTLPQSWERSRDPALIELLGDRHYRGGLQEVYVATSPTVRSTQLLFGPSGELVDEVSKIYPGQGERERLALSPAAYETVQLMRTPWGRTGVAIGGEAWMPDVIDRLDDRGAELLLWPSASGGGWATSRPPGVDWWPDVFVLGGWQAVQRSPRLRMGVVPQLVGNYFELIFDGQVQLIEDASRGGPAGAFVGQRVELPGNALIGPWVVPDPLWSVEGLGLQERRALLREETDARRPGGLNAGDYVEGVWAADVLLRSPEQSPTPEIATHPALIRAWDGPHLVTSQGEIGRRKISMTRLDADLQAIGQSGSVGGVGSGGGDLIRPAVISAGAGAGYLTAHESIEPDGRHLLGLTYSDPKTFTRYAVPLSGGHNYHPDLARQGKALYMAFTSVGPGGVARAHVLQGRLEPQLSASPFGATAARPVVPNDPSPAVQAGNQWDVKIVATDRHLVVVWLEHVGPQGWQVQAAVSADGGLSWSRPLRVDDAPAGVETFHHAPALAALPSGAALIVWSDVRSDRDHSRIGARLLHPPEAGGTRPTLGPMLSVAPPDEGVSWAWRPDVAVGQDGSVHLVWEALLDAGRALRHARLEEDSTGFEAPTTLWLPGQGVAHFPTLLPPDASGQGGAVFFEVVEPFSQGSRVSSVPLPARR